MIRSHQALARLTKILVCFVVLNWSWPSWGLPSNTTQGSIYSAAGTGIAGYSGDGAAARQAQIAGAQGLAVDRNGNLYIADSANHRVRKVTPAGTITSIAGTATTTGYFGGLGGYSGDGGPAVAASLNRPVDVAVDSVGNVYVADEGNNRVRKISVDGRISTVAGSGVREYFRDGGAAILAGLVPTAVAVDQADNLYVADGLNRRIYKIVDGILTTVAGNGSYSGPATPQMLGEGKPATSAPIGTVTSMAFDSAGNLYFSDHESHLIRKVAGGVVTTVAGDGTYRCDRDVGPASNVCFASPYGIAIDKYDNLYVVAGNGSPIGPPRFVSKISNGVVTLITPSGRGGGLIEGQSALQFQLYEPRGLAIDGAGNLYIAQYQMNPRANDWSRVFVVATSASATDIVGLSISCPDTISAGTSASCSSIVTYGNGTSKPVTASWTSSGPAATMSGNTLSANNVPGDTLVTIAASYTENGVAKTASQVVTIKSSSEPALQDSIDCFFNWAEANLPALFNPPAGSSQTSNQYRYRRYDGSNMVLSVSTDTLRVFYSGDLSGGAQLDIGPFQAWKAKACTAGVPNAGNGGAGSGAGGGTTTVAITSAAVPNVTGTAKAGATVTLTATNTTTGEVRAVSTVAGADKVWTITLSGLPDGSYELQPEADGIKGGTVTVVVDSQAPVSTLSITSNNGPNSYGWFTGPVNLALTATDGTGGSGVARSEYTLDGGEQTVFPETSLTLNTDGNHSLCYRSVDKAGNAEATRCEMIPIDATVPTVNPVFTPANSTLALNAQDQGSGIASIEISLDGGQNWIAQSGPISFTRDDTYVVQYRVRDNAGNLATGQTTVTVATAPDISAPVDQTAVEAAPQSFNLGSFADHAADNPWSVDIDWGDGGAHNVFTLASPGTLGSLTRTYADNGNYTVTIKVTDRAGNTGIRSFTVAVSNAAPTAVFTATSGPLNEGEIATLALSSPADPSAVDTQAGFRYAFDCGDGNGYGVPGTASTATCAALDNPNQTVKGQVIDKDGGATEYSAVIEVNNVAPAMGAITGPASSVERDTLVTLSANFTDPGVRDTHTVSLVWDDGTASSGTVTEANGSGSVSASHSYASPGRYNVTMTVTDKDGASVVGTYTVQVRGGPPVR